MQFLSIDQAIENIENIWKINSALEGGGYLDLGGSATKKNFLFTAINIINQRLS